MTSTFIATIRSMIVFDVQLFVGFQILKFIDVPQVKKGTVFGEFDSQESTEFATSTGDQNNFIVDRLLRSGKDREYHSTSKSASNKHDRPTLVNERWITLKP